MLFFCVFLGGGGTGGCFASSKHILTHLRTVGTLCVMGRLNVFLLSLRGAVTQSTSNPVPEGDPHAMNHTLFRRSKTGTAPRPPSAQCPDIGLTTLPSTKSPCLKPPPFSNPSLHHRGRYRCRDRADMRDVAIREGGEAGT